MNPDEMAARAASFAQGASGYDRLRPEYPGTLFADLHDRAGRRLAGQVLEIGAGTGRATLPLARRGAVITVVEPSKDMLRILSERLEAEALANRVTLRQATFEDVDTTAVYDVVVAAQSFHWTNPATRWTRLASLLGASGIAFLFWNGWHLDSTRHDVEAIRAVYATYGNGLTSDLDDHRSATSWVENEVDAEPALVLAESKTYQWSHRLTIEEYLGLLSTTSQYAIAPSDLRGQLFGHLRSAVGPTAYLHGRTSMLVIHTTRGPAGSLS